MCDFHNLDRVFGYCKHVVWCQLDVVIVWRADENGGTLEAWKQHPEGFEPIGFDSVPSLEAATPFVDLRERMTAARIFAERWAQANLSIGPTPRERVCPEEANDADD